MKNTHFELIQSLRDKREAVGLTQAEVSHRMNTTPSSIARLEKKTGRNHSPSLRTIIKYFGALGYELVSFDVRKIEDET